MPEPFSVRQLGPGIGAEIVDLDLSRVSTAATLQRLESALVRHEVLVLHVPGLSADQHLAIAHHFGDAEVHTFFPNLGPGYEQITIIDSTLGDRADMWHADESFLPSPPIVSMTHAKILPPTGGDTCWASMTAAYAALSDRMQQHLDGLSAWHDMNQPMTLALRAGAATLDRYLDVVNQKRRHLHPVVITHPVSGRKALYVSPTYVTHIEGVPAAESAMLLTFLYAHCQQIAFMFRLRWTAGDMVIWDNRSVLHHAILDYQPHQRRMQRASVFSRGDWRVGASDERKSP